MDGEERTLKWVINIEEREERNKERASVFDKMKCSSAIDCNGMNKKNKK